MKEKGFTLIELLAIIVILAIIAVIAVPQVSKTIEDSRKNATKDSAYGYKNAVHQYYLTNSSNDDEFDLNGSYDVIDGSLSDGLNSYNILLNGDVPKSGSVNIEDGEIVDGCIDYGKYSVNFEKGDVTEAVLGGCYNISFFTYDENATAGEYGTITSKLSSPNSNWPYYVKEYNYTNKYIYGIWDKEDEDFASNDYAKYFSSIEKCQEYFEYHYTDAEDLEMYECRQRDNYKTYQICGVYEGSTFCLKLGANYYNYNVGILESTFDNCEDYSTSYSCNDDGYIAAAYREGIAIGVRFSNVCLAIKDEDISGAAVCRTLNNDDLGFDDPGVDR